MEQNNAEYWGLTGSPGTHCETGDPSEKEEDVEVEEEDVEVDCDDREEDVEEPKYSIVVIICGRCLLIHSARQTGIWAGPVWPGSSLISV